MIKRQNTAVILLFAVIISCGLIGILTTVQHTKKQLMARALEQATIIARSINIEHLAQLKGVTDDLPTPHYIRLKDQLCQIRLTHTTCRFLYLMGRKENGDVFFFLDSQMTDSKDYASPGLIYDEVPDNYIDVFEAGKPKTVGPVIDRWGRLITSLVPLHHPETGDLMAVLGMDIEAGQWNRNIFQQSLLPASLTLIVMLLTILLTISNRNRQKKKARNTELKQTVEKLQTALNEVKTLAGLLPICAQCKKIRDDEGYWNKIENYIKDHSDADFTHSICPECAKKLYPDFYKVDEDPG